MSIFARFAGVSSASFVLLIGLSAYFLYQLFTFYTSITYIVEIDGRLLDGEKKTAGLVLAQVQYEKKYLILKDRQMYEEYRKTAAETSGAINELIAIADTDAGRTIAQQIRESYDTYSAVAEEEIARVRGNRPYRSEEFRTRKDALESDLFAKLELLKEHARQDSFKRIGVLRDAVYEARNVTWGIASFSFLMLLILSFLVAKSITQPIDSLIRKSRSIAQGNLDVERSVTSPPEIAELDEAFYRMALKLRQIDAMKSDFFTTMSHELRTPLTSINEGAQLLLEDSDVVSPDVRRRLATIISEQSERLVGLVNSLLDLSRMEAGMMPYHFRIGAAGPLIEQVMKEHEPLAASRGIELSWSVDPALKPVRLDEERILQVVRNLVGNAFRFTPRNGKISIHARMAAHELLVSVIDTGAGIAEEDLSSIFEKYRQSAPAAKRGSGTGLGLAIVKNIILAHGGNVWAESTLGHGSTFTFSLPCS